MSGKPQDCRSLEHEELIKKNTAQQVLQIRSAVSGGKLQFNKTTEATTGDMKIEAFLRNSPDFPAVDIELFEDI